MGNRLSVISTTVRDTHWPADEWSVRSAAQSLCVKHVYNFESIKITGKPYDKIMKEKERRKKKKQKSTWEMEENLKQTSECRRLKIYFTHRFNLKYEWKAIVEKKKFCCIYEKKKGIRRNISYGLSQYLSHLIVTWGTHTHTRTHIFSYLCSLARFRFFFFLFLSSRA